MNQASRYRLAIGIPTYNRAALLNELLWNLGPQIQQRFPDCVCYVIDNASPDNTADIVRQHTARWPGIHYIRNDTNIGGLHNIGRAIDVPDAEWVWLMGDDDVPMPWAVKDLLEQLQALEARCDNAAFMLLSDVKLNGLKGRTTAQDVRFFNRPGDEITIYSNGAEAAEHGIHGIAWLSILAINRRYWDQARFEALARDFDLYTHVRVLLEAASKASAAYSKRCYVYGTDLGSREYYFSKTAIARIREFPEIEQVIVDALGLAKAREVLKPGRGAWVKERGAYAAKIGVFQQEYAAHLPFLRQPLSPFWEERLIITAAYLLTRLAPVRAALRRAYFRSRGDRASVKVTLAS